MHRLAPAYSSVQRGRRCDYDRGVSDPLTVEARLTSSLGQAVADKLRAAASGRVAERVREGDATLWGPPGAAEIADRLGWLTIAERMQAQVEDLDLFARGVRDDGLEDVVLLGMGGSSLAPEVPRRCFRPRAG